MLLMTSYLITIANDHHDGQGLKEQLLKMSRADVLSSTKTLRKTLRGVASPPPPPHPHLYVRGLRLFPYHLSRVHAFESVKSIRDISKCTNKSLKSSLTDKVIVAMISNH